MIQKITGGESGICGSPLEGEPNLLSRFGGGHSLHNKPLAQMMRKKMTPWEFKLWMEIKGKKLGGYKFRRQQPIGHYIVDFVNVEKKLIFELDGSQHLNAKNDEVRNKFLSDAGYRVLRIWNNEIDTNLDGVLLYILDVLKSPHRNAKAFRLPLKGGAKDSARNQS